MRIEAFPLPLQSHKNTYWTNKNINKKVREMQIKITKETFFKELKDYVFILIGMVSYCIGWNVFLLPNNVTASGVPGIVSIIFWGLNIPVHLSYFTIQAVLMIVALKVLGLKFCIKTIYAVSVVTILTSYFTLYVKDISMLQDQPFMGAVLGAVFCGCGVGMGFAFNGSTGGTDIIAAVINKYKDISLGRVIMLCDILIVTSSYLVLHSWEKVVYGYVVLYISAFCIDQVVNSRRRSVQFFIISEKYKEIGNRINIEIGRGCTIVKAYGFHSSQEKPMLFVLVRKSEASQVFRLIEETDHDAFVSQSAVIGVYGEGFDHIKYKHKNEEKQLQ